MSDELPRKAIINSDGNANVTVKTLDVALNKTDDSITNYPVACNMTVVDLATATTTVSASPAVLLGIYCNIVTQSACIIADAAVTKLTLPATWAAGTKIDCHSATFATSLIVDPVDADTTGQIVVFWRAI